ncbi:MAG: adenosine-specific kinase [Caldisericia bacterium]|nr:adenosine-specific kinase [Caldisericia bacterium]MDD4614213.1 adenosine-specific kinase [Caldisericia bacterium]
MEIIVIPIYKPDDLNFILGQSHFIKTVEDLHEALIQSSPGVRFGIAFCEASGKCLIRFSGNDDKLIELAKRNAELIGAGHCFIIFMEGIFPISVLNRIQEVPEVCHIFCATANPTQVLLVETKQGRGILGVVDGNSPKGIETEEDVIERKRFLRTIGYKL